MGSGPISSSPILSCRGGMNGAQAAAAVRAALGKQVPVVYLERALRHMASPSERSSMAAAAAMRVAGLTRREREVMDYVVAGHANKEIAARLGIDQRTVETHRANVMKKMGAASLSELVRLVTRARDADPPSEPASNSTGN